MTLISGKLKIDGNDVISFVTYVQAFERALFSFNVELISAMRIFLLRSYWHNFNDINGELPWFSQCTKKEFQSSRLFLPPMRYVAERNVFSLSDTKRNGVLISHQKQKTNT